MLVSVRRRVARMTPMVLVAVAALTAKAGVPDVLDRVPAETPVVVAVGNLEGTMKRVEAMSKSLGKAGENMAAGLWQVNSMLNMPGVNKGGSMAIAVSMPEKKGPEANEDAMEDGEDGMVESDDPPAVIIVPVSDYALFVKTFKGDGAAAITRAEFDGKETWLRNLGDGYAAMSDKKELVEKFDGKAGRKAEHIARMGKVGNKISDSTEIIILANMSKLGPAMKALEHQMKDNPAMAMAAMQGGGQAVASMQAAMEKFARDAQTGIIGVGLTERGMTLDFGAQFKEGTDGAKMFQAVGNSASLMSKLPAGDFLFAFAGDYSSPKVKQFVKDLAAQNMEGKEADPTSMMGNLARSIDSLDGQAMYMGATDLGNGLMSKTVIYSKAKDPQAVLAATKESTTKLNGAESNGIKFETTYQSNAKEIGGVKVDKWTNKMETDPNSPMAMQVEMMKSFMYGSEGKLSGYAAATDGGVVMTMSENSQLLTAALESSKGGKSLGTDPVFSASQSMLLADRVFEGYIGTKALMETVGGFMAMYGGPEIPVPEKVSPIAFGFVSDGGGMGLRVAMPMDVIQTIANTAEKMQGAMGEMGEPEDEKPAEKKKDSGRRF